MKLPRISEKEFQAQVVQFAKLCGWRIYHTHDSRDSVAGFPDLILIRRDKIKAAELKVGRRKCTPAQLDWLAAFAGAGVMTYVWTPEDWPEIEMALRC